MPEARRFPGLPVFGFAAAGLLLGHALSYVFVFADTHHRDLVLHRTGHDYLPVLGQVALILALAAVAVVVHGGVARRGSGGIEPFGSLASRLALVQIGAFGAQEVLERVAVGAPLADLARWDLPLAGLTAQVVVAFAGAALLRWLARTSAALIGAATRPVPIPRPVPAFAIPWSPDVPPGRIDAVSYGERAPPSA